MTVDPRRVLAPALLATLLVTAGCGGHSDSADSGGSGPVVTTDTDTPRAPYPPIPTATELDAQFKSAIDPKQPDSVRAALIQDGQAFLVAVPDLYKALRENPNARYGIVDPVFDNRDGTITATMRLDRDGTGAAVQAMPVHFLALDGRWKLSRTDLCGILVYANYHTPACG